MNKYLSIILLVITISYNNSYAGTNEDFINQLEDNIKSSLFSEGVDGKLKISIRNMDNILNLQNPNYSYETIINNMDINRRNQRFKAELILTTQGNQQKRKVDIVGSYDQLVNIPVLAQRLPSNTVISENDLKWIEIPQEQIRFDVITKQEKLIGQTIKRQIPELTPVKERDLQKAQIISRNNSVNILYSTSTIELKTIGIAMESGGEGDVIKVRNASSNKIIQAIIKDKDHVAVSSQGKDLLSANNNIGDEYVR